MLKTRKIFVLFYVLTIVFFFVGCLNQMGPSIFFDSNGGSDVESVKIDGVSTLVLPDNPVKIGYSFLGWYLDNSTFNYPFTTNYALDNPISNDITVYAKWVINQYTITFDSNGGSEVSSITQDFNTLIIPPANPTRTHYTFLGWDSQIPTSMPGENIILTAQWQIDQYSITFYSYDHYDPITDIFLFEGETFTSSSLGLFHSSAITSEGRIFAWGLYNDSTECGYGTSPIEITPQFHLHNGETITGISMGGRHYLSITSEGRIFTWGNNDYGQLGDGSKISRAIPTDITTHFNLHDGETITSISTGRYHSSALTNQGRIFTWGKNDFGQLGNGMSAEIDSAYEIPMDITSQFILRSTELITNISLGFYQSSAFTNEGRLFVWGANGYGQLGDGTSINRNTPIDISNQFIFQNGEIIVDVSLGDNHSSALTNKGRLFVWGHNKYGQLGDGTDWGKMTPIEITSHFDLHGIEKITSISFGNFISSAITSEGRVFTWGLNSYGNLGDASITSSATPTDISSQFNLNDGEIIRFISLGYNHSSAISSEGRVFMWGRNENAQLGNGTVINSLSPISIIRTVTYSTSSSTYNYNEIIADYTPTREGYTFDGWYSDYTLTIPYLFGSMPAEDVKVYGRWISN